MNPGKKSSKFNWDCTICPSCRWIMTGSAVLKWPGNGIKWTAFGVTATRSTVVLSSPKALFPPRARLVTRRSWFGSVELGQRIFEHRIFTLDGVGLGHQRFGGLAADMRLSG